MAACHKGDFSLVDNCWNDLTKSFERAPCQPTICKTSGSIPGDDKTLPDWALALIIVVLVGIFGFLCYSFLKKSFKRGFTFIFGGILAASMSPPMPKNSEEQAIRAQNLDLEGQGGGRDMVPTAPPLPTYHEAMSA